MQRRQLSKQGPRSGRDCTILTWKLDYLSFSICSSHRLWVPCQGKCLVAKNIPKLFYRPQGKVMFSKASVCSWGRGIRVSLVPCPFRGYDTSGPLSLSGGMQWRIQDFPQGGGANSQKCYYFSIFCRKLHENERIWTPGGGVPGTPPWIRQWYGVSGVGYLGGGGHRRGRYAS